MTERSAILVRTLLNRFSENTSQALLKRLPEDEAKEVSEQVTSFRDPYALLKNEEDFLSEVHYSWLPLAIKKIPSSLQRFVIKALDSPKALQLAKLVQVPPPLGSYPKPLKSFLLKELIKNFWPMEVLPKSLLPESPFSPLLSKDKKTLVELIDFLGLFDLSEEIRCIVDKNLLRQIYSHLSPKKVQFLRRLLHQKERFITPKLDLDRWDGKKKTLDTLLHKRGISRFALALSGQHRDIIWYLVHILDTGRGNLLDRQISQEEIPAISSGLVQQVIYTYQFLKSEDHS